MVEIKDYNVMIDGQNLFDQPVKNDLRTYYNIQKIANDRKVDYISGCLLDYNYFNNYYKMIAIDLNSKDYNYFNNYYKMIAVDLNSKHLMLIQMQYN